MPARNVVKEYGEGMYYHVYNRGSGKAAIFREPDDYEVMLGLFKRHLDPEVKNDRYGREIRSYDKEVELVAYCLMPNHYHLMVYLKHKEGLTHLMKAIMTSYSMYFNKKYKRSGGLFQGIFRASRINNDAYYWHISRYIHLNPMDIPGVDYTNYPYSSLTYYLGEKHALWLHEEYQVRTGEERIQYAEFVSDYISARHDLKLLKKYLAD